MNQMTPKNGKMAVIFDMDGVIVDSAPHHFSAWQKVWQRRGVPYSYADFKHNFGQRSDLQVRYIVGNKLSQDEVKTIVAEKDILLREILKDNMRALPGAVELIKSLNEYGVKLALGSSSPKETVYLVAETLGVEKYFDAIVCGSEVREGKPNPQIFLLSAKRINVEPWKCMVVEDAVVGITAAKRGGMYVLAVTNTHPRESLMDADIVVDSLNEVTVQSLEDFMASTGCELRAKP